MMYKTMFVVNWRVKWSHEIYITNSFLRIKFEHQKRKTETYDRLIPILHYCVKRNKA